MYEVAEFGDCLYLMYKAPADNQFRPLVMFISEEAPSDDLRIRAQEMCSVLNDNAPRVISSREGRQNIFDVQEDRDNEDAPRLDGGSWKPACDTSDEEAEDVVGQPIDLPIPGEGPREL